MYSAMPCHLDKGYLVGFDYLYENQFTSNRTPAYYHIIISSGRNLKSLILALSPYFFGGVVKTCTITFSFSSYEFIKLDLVGQAFFM